MKCFANAQHDGGPARCLKRYGWALLLLLPLSAHADTLSTDRTQATLAAEISSVHAGETFWTMLHLKLQPGWHTYWKNPGDSGTVPVLSWTLPNGFNAGEIQYLAPDREVVGPLVDYAYSDNAYYLVQLKAPPILGDNATAIIALKAEWLVCKDVCIPEKEDLSLTLPATSRPQVDYSADAETIAGPVRRLPVKLAQPLAFQLVSGQLQFDAPIAGVDYNQIRSALFFPAEDGLIANAADQDIHVKPDAIGFALKPAEGELPKTASGLVSLYMTNGERKDYDVRLQSADAPVPAAPKTSALPSAQPAQAASETKFSLLKAAVYAFIGGLVLNLMPCVFPILSLKCLAVVKKSAAHPDEVRAQGLAYALGVVLSFVALAGLLIGVQHSTGQEIGWGYQMQSPLFVAALSYLLFLVGLNLSGYFELPVLFGNIGAGAPRRDNVIGSFLTGMLAVLVATPCTAPFMAPAVGFALTQDASVIFIIFVMLGLGLAAPFLLISLFPQLTKFLPKPGVWMLHFKQLLAFPMYLSVVWLLWVLSHEAGEGAAPVILCGMTFLAFAVWLGKRDSRLARFAALLIAVASFSLSLAMIHPIAGLPQKVGKLAEPFSTSKLEALRAQGQPVFVDATADWCLTCKLNEGVALSSAKIAETFEQKHIVYMVADWTRGDRDITRYLESFGRRGVPIYVYYPPNHAEPQVLPQLLTESIVLEAIR